MIHFVCPKCAAKYQCQLALAGRPFACRDCKTQFKVPPPELEPEEELDQLEEVEEQLDQLEEVEEPLEALPAVEAWPPKPQPPKKRKKEKKQRLIARGNNGSVELVGTELVFRHDGSFGTFGPRIRAGTYRHSVLAITKIEFVAPGLLEDGRIRFVFGNERLDANVAYVLDTQTIVFSSADHVAFRHFQKEVERFRRLLIDDIRMNNR